MRDLGHLTSKSLVGAQEAGPPHKMHQSMGGIDYPPTFFDKGFAEHFQPRVRDAITDVHLRKLIGGKRRNRLRVALAEH